MNELLDSFAVHDDEIYHFEAYDKGYFALLNRGPRLDILRVFNFQPDIADFSDYVVFMFIEALQGFYVLRQPVLEGHVGPWRVCMEMRPKDPNGFFAWAFEHRGALMKFILENVKSGREKSL